MSPSWPASFARRAMACSRSRASAASSGARDVGDAVVADVVEAGVDVAVLAGLPPAFFGGSGVVPDQCFLDEPVDLGPGHAVGERGELPVDEPGGVGGRSRVWSVIRSAFHTGTCPSRTRAQSLGEAVGELDDLADVVASGVQGPAEQRTELHDREVADQGCAGAGEREAGVQTTLGQRGDVVRRRRQRRARQPIPRPHGRWRSPVRRSPRAAVRCWRAAPGTGCDTHGLGSLATWSAGGAVRSKRGAVPRSMRPIQHGTSDTTKRSEPACGQGIRRFRVVDGRWLGALVSRLSLRSSRLNQRRP